jgi:ribosomal protein S1
MSAAGSEAIPVAGGDAPARPQGVDDVAAMAVPPRVRVGSVVEGTVVSVTADRLLVDIGGKADGVVPLMEAVVPAGKGLTDVFVPGQVVPVTVLGYDAQDGSPRLSQRRAVEAQAWRRLEEAWRTGQTVQGTVTEAVKGGLVLDLGVRAFMPASHVERGHVPDLTPYVGRELSCRVIEIDRGRGKVIASRKALLEEEARAAKERLWSTLAEGQVCQGTVKSLTDFGAFVDLGGVDGLVHISAMAWGRVAHPSEVVSVGDPVTVKILKLDREHGKISLGMKQLLPDPWSQAATRYAVGSVVEGTVARIVSFGAFVQLEPGVDGLVHVSQMADRRVHDPREVVCEGQRVRARVIRVVPDEHRISLSLREVDPIAPEETGARPHGPTAGGGVTFGEVVGDIGGLLRRAAGGEDAPAAGERPGPEDAAGSDAAGSMASAT